MWLYIWLGITALALILEFVTSDMISIWFVGGGLIAIILSACSLAWYIHLPIFIAVSFILLFSFRPIVMKKLMANEEKTNADSAIGKEYTLLTDIGFNMLGTIKIGDVIWNVDTENEREEIPAGTVVEIVKILGNKYIVKKSTIKEN